MAITDEPKVGKFLLRKIDNPYGFDGYAYGGKITKIQGKRVYYDDNGTERFALLVAGVCDTEAEAREIVRCYESWVEGARQWCESANLAIRHATPSLAPAVRQRREAEEAAKAAAVKAPEKPAPTKEAPARVSRVRRVR